MMELLLKEIREKHETTETNRRKDKEDFLAKLDVNEAKAEARHNEMMADWKAWGRRGELPTRRLSPTQKRCSPYWSIERSP